MFVDDTSGGDSEPQGYWFETKLAQVGESQLHCTTPNTGYN
jgi:hypothetical protein